MRGNASVAVIIPALNEEQAIGLVLSAIPDWVDTVIVADNGSNWFFQGAPSPLWDDDDLGQLKSVSGEWFEVVDTGPIRR